MCVNKVTGIQRAMKIIDLKKLAEEEKEKDSKET